MQMLEKNEIKEYFIFRQGDLQIVFAFIKVIGKYNNGSGIDHMLNESWVHCPTTIRKIFEGKHTKRGMEANMTIYL